MPPKTVLITGCGQASIGTALAKEFRSRGHTVFATNWQLNDVDPSLSEMGCHVLEFDVTSTASIENALKFVTEATSPTTTNDSPSPPASGRLDMLINNAGILQILPFADTSVEDARRVYEVNVLGAWAVSRAFLPLLLAAGASPGGSSPGTAKIVNLCSINEVLCPPFLAAYNSSKAALEAMGKTMRRELAPLGVQVVTLKCGSVDTGLFTSNAVSGGAVPEGSLYAGLREWIERREFLKEGLRAAVTREVFARQVADELLKEKPSAVIWKGGLAMMHWFMSLCWDTMLDRTLIKYNHLDTMSWSSPKA
ncbi:NADPH-dependent 1-acyldihydroxyacetone phosphate reductase [Madurella mycetomatis]|uniref:NADPH-dependent 1-acyldihydroxyacetone phosphate reductase n=1 Tax=Madurella mycetomatis TaxID=100816 RepID=A0A175VQ90_9PEZI|nr:NADPH-dependent 1-acyldihydroxyacetone phosphate reductase [Madurella mycetomatis]KXX73694.1 NADPH-dependent 1-acyldihydroxyacetone phosphate reductase [Madurella mycetomatis]